MLQTMRTRHLAHCAAALLARRLCHHSDAACAAGRSGCAERRAQSHHMGREPQRLPAGREVGYEAWLEQQLHPRPAVLPAAAQAQIDALTISQKPMQQLVQELEAQRRDYDKAMADDEAKKPRSAPTSRS
jgi:hypothetical protein